MPVSLTLQKQTKGKQNKQKKNKIQTKQKTKQNFSLQVNYFTILPYKLRPSVFNKEENSGRKSNDSLPGHSLWIMGFRRARMCKYSDAWGKW